MAIAFLDATDGDCDLQDDAEPTDWQIRKAEKQCLFSTEDDEDGGDHEPWLGWTRSGTLGNSLDLEEAV